MQRGPRDVPLEGDAAHDPVHHDAIEPIEHEPELLGRLDEQEVVEFVDVVFVQERAVDGLCLRRPSIRGGRVHAVQVVREPPAEHRDGGGDHHEGQHQTGAGLMPAARACHRRQELMEPAVLGRESEKAAGQGKQSQDHQGTDHDHRRFMDVRFRVMVHAGFSVEGQIGQAEHIERGQKRSDRGHAV